MSNNLKFVVKNGLQTQNIKFVSSDISKNLNISMLNTGVLEFDENISILKEISSKDLRITGYFSVNGSVGESGQVLKSDGTKAFWSSEAAFTNSNDFGIVAINGTDSGYTWGTANTNTNQIADSVGDTLTFVKGGGINLYTSTDAETDAIKIEHSDTSDAENLTASARTYVTGLTFDTYGHVTGYTTGTETVVDTDTVTRLRGTSSGTYQSGDLTLVAGSNVTITQSGTDYTITASQPTVGDGQLSMGVSGIGLSGTATFTANQSTPSTFTVTSNATSSNTSNTIVSRDDQGAFSAGTITATLAGNASTATAVSGTTTAAIETSALGSGTANSTTYLRGDRTWATVISGATLTNDVSTNADTFYPTLASNQTTGALTSATVSSTKLYFNPSSGQLNATNFNSLSDASHKTNIVPIQNGTEVIRHLNGVEFDWVDNGAKSAGIIAQDLEKVLPHLVDQNSLGVKSVNYNGLIAYLIECNKSLLDRVDALDQVIKSLITNKYSV